MKLQSKHSAVAAVLVAGLLLAAACWFAWGEHAAAQAANEITINSTQYAPKTLTVTKGATVTWTNKEAKPHTVTADDNSFASKVMKENETFSYKFEKAGTYAYHCAFHGGNAGKGMAGTIVVK